MDSNDLRQVKTKEIVIEKDEVVKDAIYFMEKQANRGAYGLMMPETHTRELIWNECRNAENYRHAGEKFELAGIAMGKTLHLPHFRIRARMVQLGNVEAKGALNYIRKDKIEPFAFDLDSWREEQHTFVIEESTVNALRRSNPDFEQIMQSGRYVYADGHVILNDPKYVQRGKEGKYVLTDVALKHVDDCCLRFVRLHPYAGLLKCPDCGKTLWCRKPRSQKTQFLLCEGENACGGFAMDRKLTDQALVNAYNSLDMDVVMQIGGRKGTSGEEAKKLLAAKEEYPVVSSVEFWWLDDHVERIEYFFEKRACFLLSCLCGIGKGRISQHLA